MSAESADKNVQTDHVQETQHIADSSVWHLRCSSCET
jgi:hypothetical protein